MAINDYIKTIEGTLMSVQDVPENTAFGRELKKVWSAWEELGKVNRPLQKLKEKEGSLREATEAADIENMTPEEFAKAKAELELTERAIAKKKPEVSRLSRKAQITEENFSKLQGEHSKDVDNYLTRRQDMFNSQADALRRQILLRYSVPESV